MLLQFRFCPKKKPGWGSRRRHGAVDHNPVEASQPSPKLLLQTSLSDALQGPEFANRAVSSSCVISVLGEQSQQSY